jgi:hypothetical protein
MRTRRFLFVFAFAIISPFYVHSQETNSNRRISVEYCGALTHQHQDFFGKAFSFTGLECSGIINHHFLAGAYASSFLSTLNVEVAGNPLYLYLWQAGLSLGILTNDSTMIHAGVLVNAGAISAYGNPVDFSVIKGREQETEMTGLVLAPQGYGEINITGWFRTRVGLAYDVCIIDNQPRIKGTDLRNISINFGFVFGTFKYSDKCF